MSCTRAGAWVRVDTESIAWWTRQRVDVSRDSFPEPLPLGALALGDRSCRLSGVQILDHVAVEQVVRAIERIVQRGPRIDTERIENGAANVRR